MKTVKNIIQHSDFHKFPFDVKYWKYYDMQDKKLPENKMISIKFYSTTKYLAHGFYKPISRTLNFSIFSNE